MRLKLHLFCPDKNQIEIIKRKKKKIFKSTELNESLNSL